MDRQNLSVGQVAKRCGVAVSALHFYENKGLIHSSRNSGNQRRYSPDVIRRVSIIKAAQKMGVGLNEIAEAFASLPKHKAPSREDWQQLSSGWQAMLNGRIRYLERLRDYLTGCIGCGCLSMANCPIYNPADKLEDQGPGPVILERGGKL